jgi:23S rRNA maturation-related 3'-5' exoribonuclease YhaM
MDGMTAHDSGPHGPDTSESATEADRVDSAERLRALEAANEQLRRINAQLARERIGVSDSGAASVLARIEQRDRALEDQVRRAELAEARADIAEARADDAEETAARTIAAVKSHYDAPRYRAADAVREQVERAPRLSTALRRVYVRVKRG